MKYILGNNVSETLFIPLISRRKVQEMYPQYFDFSIDDPIWEQVEGDIDAYYMGDSGALGTGYRQNMFENEAKLYIAEHPQCTVVNLGCGLDQVFPKVDNGQILFYNVDLPAVMELRQDLLGPDSIIEERPIEGNPTEGQAVQGGHTEGSATQSQDIEGQSMERKTIEGRERNLSKSFLDADFADYIEFDAQKGILFLMSGVVYYFEVKVMRDFVDRLGATFPGGRLLFDIGKPFSQKINERTLAKMGLHVKMPFRLAKLEEIAFWSGRIESIKLDSQWNKYMPPMKELSFKHKLISKGMMLSKAVSLVTVNFKDYR